MLQYNTPSIAQLIDCNLRAPYTLKQFNLFIFVTSQSAVSAPVFVQSLKKSFRHQFIVIAIICTARTVFVLLRLNEKHRRRRRRCLSITFQQALFDLCWLMAAFPRDFNVVWTLRVRDCMKHNIKAHTQKGVSMFWGLTNGPKTLSPIPTEKSQSAATWMDSAWCWWMHCGSDAMGAMSKDGILWETL